MSMKMTVSFHACDLEISSGFPVLSDPVGGDCIRMEPVIFIFYYYIIICSGEADVQDALREKKWDKGENKKY